MSRDEFGIVVLSLRRWMLVLGLLTLVVLLGFGAPRSTLLGFCIGWLLSIFSLDQIRHNARRLEQQAVAPEEAKTMAARTFLRRWIVIILVLGIARNLGADPVAGALALLLLQAAVMCRSIMSLFSGLGGDEPSEDESDDETLG